MVFVAPQAEWRRPVGSWVLGEASWGVEFGHGGLRMELAVGLIFGQKTGQLFVVEEAVCGEREG